ncbi:MAG: T9SS type A sorting domain-containing protein [Bacteroidales bacterium]|jgi:hypothetical protein|nr:T9SS type A sorting domain-containing protein [Bacteroidales bacterium]
MKKSIISLCIVFQTIRMAAGESHLQQPSVWDYSYMWWAEGFYGAKRQVNIQTGYYGLAVDAVAGGIVRLGALTSPPTETEALLQDNSLIDALPEVETDYTVTAGGQSYHFQSVNAVEGGNNSTRILESGRYMQRLDLMYLTFAGNNNLKGRMEVACMPEFLSLAFEVYSPVSYNNARLTLSLRLPGAYSEWTPSMDGRALTVTGTGAPGITFMIPKNSNATITRNGQTVIFNADGITIPTKQFTGFSVIVMPSVNASPADAVLHDAREKVTVSAVQVSPNKGRQQPTSNVTATGYKSISLNDMVTQSNDPAKQNSYDRLTFTLTNPGDKTVRVPVQFVKDEPLPVTGLSPFLSDAETEEPVGVQVQLTKNWHYYSISGGTSRPSDDPARNWEGVWYHGYTLIEVPAGKSVSYGYTCPFARYGNVFAVSHAQLCLVGWGGHQQWETAALGSFGENFCYDANQAWTQSFLGDICPALVTSRVNNEQYNWTLNVGAADFLVYHTADHLPKIPFARMRTRFKKQGPVVTEVIYTGITADGAVEMEYKAEMPRTDDASKAIHSFKYTFLKDVTFSRLAFYQFGADQYNVGIYDKMAVGNDAGVGGFSIGGQNFSGEFNVPKTGTNAYWLSENMQRIEVEGEGLWFAFLGGQPRPGTDGAGANKVLSVLDFKATLNGTEYHKPAFNIRTTNTLYSGALIELCPPASAGNTITAGSVVEGAVAFINLPAHKNDYYGPSKVLSLAPSTDFTSWRLSHLYATQTKMRATATVGVAERNMPCELVATGDGDGTVCEFTVSGGIGYVPVTVKNLPGYAGWQLQQWQNSSWINVNQAVHGNDWWQAWYDAETATYELSYTLPHTGKNDVIRYRLVKSDGAVAVPEPASVTELQLFPNPVSNRFYFKWPHLFKAPLIIEIFDSSGKTVLSRYISNVDDGVDVSKFPEGMYIVKIYDKTTCGVGKIIKR